MYAKKSEEQLIKEYAEIGVDYNKFIKFGEMNVIVQSFAIDKYDDVAKMEYLNFMPRRGYASEQTVDLNNEDDRKWFIAQLRDSAERMKVWAYLIAKKADEIEKGVYDGTSVYYPEFKEYYDDGNKPSDE